MGSSSSHISGGHGDKAHYNRGVLYGAVSLTSYRMLPHCAVSAPHGAGIRPRVDRLGSQCIETVT